MIVPDAVVGQEFGIIVMIVIIVAVGDVAV